MHFDIGVVAVRFACEQGFDLTAARLCDEPLQRLDAFLLGRGVILALAELDQRDGVVELALEASDGAQAILELVALAHELLRNVRIVPEIGVFGFGVQFREAARRCIDVKDASSAVPRTA